MVCVIHGAQRQVDRIMFQGIGLIITRITLPDRHRVGSHHHTGQSVSFLPADRVWGEDQVRLSGGRDHYFRRAWNRNE